MLSLQIARSAWRSGLRSSARSFYSADTRKYTKDHEWVSFDKSSGLATIGITEFAQEALGDVIFVELPKKGRTLKQKDSLGAVESVKAASDIYAPVSGTVHEANNAVAEEPSLINSSPLEKGWICKIKVSEPDQITSLLDRDAYHSFIKST